MNDNFFFKQNGQSTIIVCLREKSSDEACFTDEEHIQSPRAVTLYAPGVNLAAHPM